MLVSFVSRVMPQACELMKMFPSFAGVVALPTYVRDGWLDIIFISKMVDYLELLTSKGSGFNPGYEHLSVC